jgi:hypothetical protein
MWAIGRRPAGVGPAIGASSALFLAVANQPPESTPGRREKGKWSMRTPHFKLIED